MKNVYDWLQYGQHPASGQSSPASTKSEKNMADFEGEDFLTDEDGFERPKSKFYSKCLSSASTCVLISRHQ